MPLETDLNIPPYNDDQNPQKNYHRILFRPSMPVQARELNQIQTIFQEQIERFGNHIFKDGSVISGIGLFYYPKVPYISLEDYFNSNASASVSDFDSSYLITNSTDSNNAVRAVIKIAKDGSKDSFPETNRIYLDYITTGTDLSDNDVNEFLPGDTLYFYSNTQLKYANLNANNLVDTIDTLESNGSFTSNGVSYCVGVTEGYIYQKGFFIRVDSQILPVKDFDTVVNNYVVGFNTEELIIDEYEDTTLYDNALGYSNENAPGAHRLKLVPTLVSKSRDDIANNYHFFAIVEFDGDSPSTQMTDPAYNELGKVIAKRTYEESGDYVVKPFKIETLVNESNNQTFFYEISPGIAYVRGYRIEKIGPVKIEAERGIETDYALDHVVTANYGNYITCVEYTGIFDTENLVEVDIYDQPQYGISKIAGGKDSSLAGSQIGKCNIRAVVHEDGTPATALASYLVYIFNIRMNSGKNFLYDARSIVVNSGVMKGRADIQLNAINGLVWLRETNKSGLLFKTGLAAVKSLTDNTGTGDTSFVYTQMKNGTLGTNGKVAITIDAAATGGVEKLNSTPGAVLTGTSLDDYSFFANANVYSSNITTVAISSGNTTVIGASLLSAFDEQELVYILDGASNQIRRVVEIANNTHMYLDAPSAATNASCNVCHFYMAGSPLPMVDVTINSNTSFTANLGYNASASTTVWASYPVLREQTVSIPKHIRKNRFVKIDCGTNVAGITGPWNLGLIDGHKIRHVYVGTTYANTNPDYGSDWFRLDSGQTWDFYGHSKLILKPQYKDKLSSSSKLLVEFDHFEPNTSISVGFFSRESYPIDDANTSNTTAIQTIELPIWADRIGDIWLTNGDYVDFRPYIANTANSATTIADATVNPAVAYTFVVPASGQHLVVPDSNFIANFEYYLSRKDLITLNPVGKFNVIKGVASLTPRTPFVENDQSAIAEVHVPPYPTATQRIYDIYRQNLNFSLSPVNVKDKTNKRYTMKDIGTIDDRVKRIEYITILNTLEQQARDETIFDANGIDRFKNGIFADPFNSHNNGDISNYEYKVSIDPHDGVARPYINRNGVDLEFISSNSTNITKTGHVLSLPFTSEVYIYQKFATKTRRTSEHSWEWLGKVNLYPSEDHYRDETTEPARSINSDIGTNFDFSANRSWGLRYGDWRIVNKKSDITVYSQANTTQSNEARDSTKDSLLVNTITNDLDQGSYIQDISINPYIRSRLVAFVCYNMKPNTTLHAFFDDVNIDSYCAPGVLSGVTNPESGKEDQIVTRISPYGYPLVTDSTGFVCGIFRIPAQTFRTGEKLFQLTNVDNIITGTNKTTIGKARYVADQSTYNDSSTLTVKAYELNDIGNTATAFSTTTTDIEYNTLAEDSGYVSTLQGSGQPITQSFFINNLPADVSGTFITKIGLYFYSVDPTLGCSVYIAEMNGNEPNGTKVLGKSYKASSSIVTSATGSSETQFVFEHPIFLLSGRQYCFIVKADGNSPLYKIWTGENGGYDVNTNEQVYSNPYSGTLFISSNRTSWVPVYEEDVKFNMYRARFTSSLGYAVFKNDNVDYLTVDKIVRANDYIAVSAGDLVFSVNATSNATITANTGPQGTVQFIDDINGKIWVDTTVTGFSNTTDKHIRIYNVSNTSNLSSVNSSNYVAYANIESVDNIKYHAVVPRMGVLQPSKTILNYDFKGTLITNVQDTYFRTVSNYYEYELFDNERHVMSRTNEVADLSSDKSSIFQVTLQSDNDFVSPMINLSKKSLLLIENVINNDVTDEHTQYGNAHSKYISKKIILADGQEAEDLKVYMSAYKPVDTDITVYVKLKSLDDPETFDQKVWSIMRYDNGGEYVTSVTNGEDYQEFEFSMPTSNAVAYGAFSNSSTSYNSTSGTVSVANNSNILTGTGTAFTTEYSAGDLIKIASNTVIAYRTVENITNATSMTVDTGLPFTNTAALSYVFENAGNGGVIEYKDSAGSRYTGFKEFSIKIVLRSNSAEKVPKLNNLRAIALQL